MQFFKRSGQIKFELVLAFIMIATGVLSMAVTGAMGGLHSNNHIPKKRM